MNYLINQIVFGIIISVFTLSCSVFDKKSETTSPKESDKRVSTEIGAKVPGNKLKRKATLGRLNLGDSSLSAEAIVEEIMPVFEKMLVDTEQLDLSQGQRFEIKTDLISLEGRPEIRDEGINSQQSRFEIKLRTRIVNTRTQRDIYNVQKTVVHNISQVRIPGPIGAPELISTRPSFVIELLKDILSDFVVPITEALAKTNWEGRIASIKNQRYFLNVGEVTGIKVGDILKVFGDEEEIYDPQNGKFIGTSSGKPKGTIEIVEFFGSDGSVAKIHSGGGFRENDRIELF